MSADLLWMGILIGIFIGVVLDRLLLKAVATSLFRHGWR